MTPSSPRFETLAARLLAGAAAVLCSTAASGAATVRCSTAPTGAATGLWSTAPTGAATMLCSTAPTGAATMLCSTAPTGAATGYWSTAAAGTGARICSSAAAGAGLVPEVSSAPRAPRGAQDPPARDTRPAPESRDRGAAAAEEPGRAPEFAEEPRRGPDFARDVLPVLADHCFACHGPDAAERRAELRLDDARAAHASGALDASRLDDGMIARITAPDPDMRMPPPGAGRGLTAVELDVLTRWIAAGAPYAAHWAFVPPAKASLPADVHPIDALVRLAKAGPGLGPAEPETLLRRVTLDLTGLPPTPEEVEAFCADPTDTAYAAVVERLLASPAYGERMTWSWLEVARYADTNGYQGDAERTMWPWRDWVVRAFNENLPYDRFITLQLAGDLLEDGESSSTLATAFLRNHPINGEGGRIPEENRIEYVLDMTETVGTAFLGLTLNCCRCHDHKFDALSQEEYYALSAFFDSTPVDGSGGDPATPPGLEITSEDRPPARVMVMGIASEPRATHILGRGSYLAPGEIVEAGTPRILPPLRAGAGAATRLDLAFWLTSPAHPLTARVAVNRIWQEFFGRGLVATSGDFGVQGASPALPALLDWLAVEFIESGWDTKALVRLIVTSAAYRASAEDPSGAAYERDPENRFLGRGPRMRMPSWMLRDVALAAAGLLERTVGGPGVHPYQPDGLWEEASFGVKQYVRGTGADLYRRSLYTFWRRIAPPPAYFDAADRQTCSVRPSRTNSPLHALYTFNDVTFVEAARVLAQRVCASGEARPPGPERDAARLDAVLMRILGRTARAEERAIYLPLLARSHEAFAADPAAAAELLGFGEAPSDPSLDPARLAAWTALVLAAFNTDEAVTKP